MISGHIRLFILLLLLGSLGWAQQGIQGKVQFTGSAAIAVTGHEVMLSWTGCPQASSYNVYRGTTHGGPYTKIIAGITSASAVDANVQHGATYYYVVTAFNSEGESRYSNEIAATIP
jgi:fibronectin type 3 domain-containing protein